jgi:hypothetical protein
MKIMSLLVVAAIAIAAGLAVAGCKSSDSGPPSCDDAISNYYDQGCSLAQNGYPIGRSDAINWCEDLSNNVEDCSCSDEYDDMRDCFADMNNCSDCDTEWNKLMTCMGTC